MAPHVVMETSSDEGRPQVARLGSMDRERMYGSITSPRVDLAPSRTSQSSLNLTGISVEDGRRREGGKTTILLGGLSSRVRPETRAKASRCVMCSCQAWKIQNRTWRRTSAVPLLRCDARNNQAAAGLTKVCAWVTGESVDAPGSLSCVVAKVGQDDEGRLFGSMSICRYIDTRYARADSTTN